MTGRNSTDPETAYFVRRVRRAWKEGAAVYKDGRKMKRSLPIDLLLEDSSYMCDLEPDENGKIVRINFQKVSK